MKVALILSLVLNGLAVYALWSMVRRHRQEIRWIYLDWAVRFRLGEFSDVGINPRVAEDMKTRMNTFIRESLKQVNLTRRSNHTGVRP